MKMRKILSIILSIAIVMSLLLTSVAFASEGAPSTGGSNTTLQRVSCTETENDTDPAEHSVGTDGICEDCGSFVIKTAADLIAFANAVNNNDSSLSAVMEADVTLNSNVLNENLELNEGNFTSWSMIYDNVEDTGYEGTFNGKGHTISGMYLHVSTVNSGAAMFGKIGENGEVINLGIIDSYFKSTGYGQTQASSICLYNKGIIDNCYTKSYLAASILVGGICISNDGQIRNCYNLGKINSLSQGIAGIVAYNNSGVSNCYDTSCGKINFSGDGFLSNCYVLGDSVSMSTGVSTVISEKFASGEIAYRLNGSTSTGTLAFGQTIGTDATPVLHNGKNTVYRTKGCIGYSNNETAETKHITGEDGICTGCGAFVIKTADDLIVFGNTVNTKNISLNASLEADIILNENLLTGEMELNSGSFTTWEPINQCTSHEDSSGYRGTFEGNGHTISGMYIPSGTFAAMFGVIESGGAVRNLGIINSYVNGVWTSAIASSNYGTIENCYVKSNIACTISGGGICRLNVGTINNCYNIGKGSTKVGGIVGMNYENVSNCYDASCGNISISSAGRFTNCYVLSDTETSVSNATVATSEKFASGEIAYLLNGEKSTGNLAFGQKIGTDATPVFNNGKNTVYVTSGCKSYANEANVKKEHTYENDICKVCGSVQPKEPAFVNGVYQIGLASELSWFVYEVNGGNGNINACLTADITLNENVLSENGELNNGSFIKWVPIGLGEATPFKGTFDGNGYAIKGLYFNDTTVDYAGLFDNVASGSIVKNVALKDAYIYAGAGVAGICVTPGGEVVNCFTEGVFDTEESYGTAYGICASGYLTANCFTTAVDTDGDYLYVCGLGRVSENCYNLSYSDTLTSFSEESLKSGKVAYLLQNGCTIDGKKYDGSIWGQELGVDNYPVLNGANGKKVSATKGCVTYNNSGSVAEKEHNFDDTMYCIDCHKYENEEPQFKNGVYEITNVKELYWFMYEVNSGNSDISAKLMNDIEVNSGVIDSDQNLAQDTSKFKVWTPIGEMYFAGNFDGNYHKISGLYFENYVADGVGFIGNLGDYDYAKSSYVRNLGIENSYFEGYTYVGAICGNVINGVIENCYNTSTVIGCDYVGGISGACGEIYNCYNTGFTSASYAICDYYGPIVGDVEYATVQNCYYYVPGAYFTNERGIFKNAESFANGEVAYLLQDSQRADSSGKVAHVWGQTLSGSDKQALPVFKGSKVYASEGNCLKEYSNTKLGKKDHDCGEDSICKICSAYIIKTKAQLYAFAEAVNAGNNTLDASLEADIVINEDVLDENYYADTSRNYEAWTQICPGTANDTEYNGTFNGNGHTISGIHMVDLESGDGGTAMFGVIGSYGVVANLGIEDSYFFSFASSASIAVINKGVIAACHSDSYVGSSRIRGGICAENDSLVYNCCNIGRIETTESYGGIVGGNIGYVINCCDISCGNIVCTDDGYIEHCVVLGGGISGPSVLYATVYGFMNGEMARYLRSGEQKNIDGIDVSFAYGWGQTLVGKNKDEAPVITNDPQKAVYAVTFALDANPNNVWIGAANPSGTPYIPYIPSSSYGNTWVYNGKKFTALTPVNDDIIVTAATDDYSVYIDQNSSVFVFAEDEGIYQLILAAYKDGEVVETQSETVEMNSEMEGQYITNLEFDASDVDYVKAFLFDNFDNLTPLCEADAKMNVSAPR